jgi:acetyl-CoA C-acetyltransferase
MNVFVLDALRTPIGRFGGALATARPDDLLADTIRAVLARNPWLNPTLIEDVVTGAANQAGEDNRNAARMAALLAGLPETVAGVTVNRLCASGLDAMVQAARAIHAGEGSIYLAGGAESMTRAPYVMAKPSAVYDRTQQLYDTTLGWRFTNPALAAMYPPISMGETAENVAERFNISRVAQDAYALESQARYQRALAAGYFEDEIIPVTVPDGKGTKVVAADEHPRETSMEKLGALKAVFRAGGSVTAGNAAGLNDGAAISILANEAVVKEFGLTPLGILRAAAVAGVDPSYMGIGPMPAILKVLQRSGLTLADIGLIEINEAFAAQVLACRNELGLNPDILNVNGGAIAVGHPLGMSGARLAGTLLREMRRRKVRYGIAAMCIGVGQGMAALFEVEN